MPRSTGEGSSLGASTPEPSCPREEDAVAHVQGQLAPEARTSFEAHVEGCAVCAERVAEARDVLQALRGLPEPCGPVDLLPGVLERVAREAEANGPRTVGREREPRIPSPRPGPSPGLRGWRRVAAVAACALMAGIGLTVVVSEVLRGTAPERLVGKGGDARVGAEALAEAIGWLERGQEPSGGWSAARWRGQAIYDVGLTGLAVIALVDADSGRAAEPGKAGSRPRPAVLRAAGFLVDKQAEDGRFGPPAPAALYNHGIATVALLELLGSTPDDRDLASRLRPSIDRALRYIVATRCPQGGWGYLPAAGSEPNTSATAWPLQALIVARALGWDGLDDAISAGLGHMERASDGRGVVGYRRPGEFLHGSAALTSMAALCVLIDGGRSDVSLGFRHRVLDAAARARPLAGDDLYRDFFLGSALLVAPVGSSDPWRETVVASLSARQVREGADRGSWDASDPWAPAGGRLYATVVSTLVLQAERRAERLRAWTSRA